MNDVVTIAMKLGLAVFVICWNSGVLAFPDLLHVHVLARHGARTPTQPFPNDFYQEWPQGRGELTQVGMKQMYNLGIYLRNNYDWFLSSKYVTKEINVRSTDIDRSLMSTESLLAGLYPPEGSQIWLEGLNWQPIPVHTIDRMTDYVLDMDFPSCPRYNESVYLTRQSKEYKMKNSSYEEFYEFLINKTGLSPPMDPVKAWDVFDTLFCEKTHGLKLPDWATQEVMDYISKDIMPFEYRVEFGTTEKSRLKGGPYLYDVKTRMYEIIAGTLEDQKMMYHGAHDDNVLNLLYALKLGNFSFGVVPYATAIMLELWKTDTDEYAVKTIIKPGDSTNNITMILPGCTELCPIGQYYKILNAYVLPHDDINDACSITVQSYSEETRNRDVAISVLAAILALVIFVAVGIIITCRARRVRSTDSDKTEAAFPQDSQENSSIEKSPLTIKKQNSSEDEGSPLIKK